MRVAPSQHRTFDRDARSTVFIATLAVGRPRRRTLNWPAESSISKTMAVECRWRGHYGNASCRQRRPNLAAPRRSAEWRRFCTCTRQSAHGHCCARPPGRPPRRQHHPPPRVVGLCQHRTNEVPVTEQHCLDVMSTLRMPPSLPTLLTSELRRCKARSSLSP